MKRIKTRYSVLANTIIGLGVVVCASFVGFILYNAYFIALKVLGKIGQALHYVWTKNWDITWTSNTVFWLSVLIAVIWVTILMWWTTETGMILPKVNRCSSCFYPSSKHSVTRHYGYCLILRKPSPYKAVFIAQP